MSMPASAEAASHCAAAACVNALLLLALSSAYIVGRLSVIRGRPHMQQQMHTPNTACISYRVTPACSQAYCGPCGTSPPAWAPPQASFRPWS